MAGKFQPPPGQGQVFLDADGAPSYPWKQWFELIPPALTSPAFSGSVPKTATSQGIAGQIALDANFIYLCIAPNSWKRAALTAW